MKNGIEGAASSKASAASQLSCAVITSNASGMTITRNCTG
jgi:hypothetical protein